MVAKARPTSFRGIMCILNRSLKCNANNSILPCMFCQTARDEKGKEVCYRRSFNREENDLARIILA